MEVRLSGTCCFRPARLRVLLSILGGRFLQSAKVRNPTTPRPMPTPLKPPSPRRRNLDQLWLPRMGAAGTSKALGSPYLCGLRAFAFSGLRASGFEHCDAAKKPSSNYRNLNF